MKNKFRLNEVVTGIFAFSLCAVACAQTSVSVDPKQTYLRQSGEGSGVPSPAISLSNLGLAPGNLAMIKQTGSFFVNNGGPEARSMIGVFSSTGTLLANTLLNRVPGAIAAGTSVVTGTTFFGGLNTDIPEDFFISSFSTTPTDPRAVVVTIPTGATSLFLGAADTLFSDNLLGTAPYGVTVQRVFQKAFSGTVKLEDLNDGFGRNVKFDVIVDGAVVETRQVQLGVGGQFVFFSAFQGPLRIRVKGTHWLTATTGVINVGNSGVAVGTLSCKNADLDNDNEVTILDYLLLSGAYETVSGGPGWLAEADLDSDAEVSILDYLILSRNYELQGY